MSQYEEPAQQKELQWELTLNHEIEVIANPILIDILIGNILSNAIRHSENGQTISVKTEPQKLIISNPAKKELNREELFQRFKKQSESSNSIGLGLEISKKICNLYHYEIEYHFANQQHLFSILFH